MLPANAITSGLRQGFEQRTRAPDGAVLPGVKTTRPLKDKELAEVSLTP